MCRYGIGGRIKMATISELRQKAMALDMEVSKLLETWQEEHKDILDRKTEADLALWEAEEKEKQEEISKLPVLGCGGI
jgi:hypothetical protein